MVADLLHMLGVTPTDKDAWEEGQQQERQARLTGLPTSKPSSTASNSSSTTGSKKAGGACKTRPGVAGGTTQCTAARQTVSVRSVQEALALNMRSLSPEQLPEVVRETAAEQRRCRRWQRVFPCPGKPLRFAELFETPRLNNALVCKYYMDTTSKQTAK